MFKALFATILMKHDNEKKKLYYLIIKTNDKQKSTKEVNPRKMFSDAYSVPNGISRWRLEGVFSWTVSTR